MTIVNYFNYPGISTSSFQTNINTDRSKIKRNRFRGSKNRNTYGHLGIGLAEEYPNNILINKTYNKHSHHYHSIPTHLQR